MGILKQFFLEQLDKVEEMTLEEMYREACAYEDWKDKRQELKEDENGQQR